MTACEFIGVLCVQEGRSHPMRETNPFAGEEAGQVASVAYRQAAAQFLVSCDFSLNSLLPRLSSLSLHPFPHLSSQVSQVELERGYWFSGKV